MGIKEWTKHIIESNGGLISMDDREGVGSFEVPRGEGVASGVAGYVIRCLANPECKGSEEVLAAIIERRENLKTSG